MTVNGPRPEIDASRYMWNSSCMQVQVCFNGGKTPGRLVWSFCNANISSWRSTGLHLLLLQRYNHVLESVLNDFDLCDAFYRVISDTETIRIVLVTLDSPAYQCNRANVTLIAVSAFR